MLVHCNLTFFCEYTLYNLSKLCLLSCNTTNNITNNNNNTKNSGILCCSERLILLRCQSCSHTDKKIFLCDFFSDLLSAIVALCFITVQVQHVIQTQKVHNVNISTAGCSRVSLSSKKVHSLSSYTVQQYLPLASNREFVCVFQG